MRRYIGLGDDDAVVVRDAERLRHLVDLPGRVGARRRRIASAMGVHQHDCRNWHLNCPRIAERTERRLLKRAISFSIVFDNQ